MNPLMLSLLLEQSTANISAQSKFFTANNIVRDLPGRLDNTLVLHSNSPELILYPGILVSTFPPGGKKMPKAHLNYPLNGRFDIFSHHVAAKDPLGRTLFTSLLLRNPGTKTATVQILQAASFLTSPDAPFYDLPAQADNTTGQIFAGPGDRLTNLILRGLSQDGWPRSITIPAGQSTLLYNFSIPVVGARSRNTRSTLVRAKTNVPLYAASLSMYTAGDAPNKAAWEKLLLSGGLAGPRDRVPSKPSTSSRPVYGRVAGVSRGANWRAYFTDDAHGALRLTVPEPGQSISYVVATVEQGAFGTKQLQAAPLVARYNDTSYKAHGNYAVEYNLYLPLHNKTDSMQPVTLSLQTPFKSNSSRAGLVFSSQQQRAIWFRGTLRFRYRDDQGQSCAKYVHLVERRGDAGTAALTLNLAPGETRMVAVDLIYPPDCTPPQILTISNSGTAAQSSVDVSEPQ